MPVVAPEAGQGNRPLATAKPSSASRACSSRRCVSSRERCSICAESVYIALASSRPTMASTTAISTSENPHSRRRLVTGRRTVGERACGNPIVAGHRVHLIGKGARRGARRDGEGILSLHVLVHRRGGRTDLSGDGGPHDRQYEALVVGGPIGDREAAYRDI